MSVVTPFWFKQRQGKAEESAPNVVRVTGPNMKEAFLGVRQGEGGRWSAFVRDAADGPDLLATPAELDTSYSAWEAAFELYRRLAVI